MTIFLAFGFLAFWLFSFLALSMASVTNLSLESTTPVANLSPVSTTPAEFATGTTDVVDTGGEFAVLSMTPVTNNWKIADCLNLKVNLKKKMYLYVTSTT